MTDNIQKLYEIAGVEKKRFCEWTCQNSSVCDADCKHFMETKVYFPPFTAEKQLELIKWLAKRRDFALDYDDDDQVWVTKTDFYWEYYETSSEHEHFNQALAGLTILLWDDLKDDQKQEIKEILE